MFKNLLYLSILTTAVVLSWIYFSIYHNSTTSTISTDTSIRIVPIPNQFDKETIESLRLKKKIQADLNEAQASVSVIPTIKLEPIAPTGTGSANINL